MKTIQSKFDKKLIPALEQVLFDGRIIVIDSPREAKKAVDYLLAAPILGLDTETRPVFKRGKGMNPVALLQVSTHDTCFLFRLNRIGLTDDIIRLLEDETVPVIGLSLKDDQMQLSRRRRFRFGLHYDLQDQVKEFGIKDMSLQKLYANIFHRRISKGQQLSNWEADVLTEAQKRYAATDAWACIQIYEELNRLKTDGYKLEIIPDPVPEEGQGGEPETPSPVGV